VSQRSSVVSLLTVLAIAACAEATTSVSQRPVDLDLFVPPARSSMRAHAPLLECSTPLDAYEDPSCDTGTTPGSGSTDGSQTPPPGLPAGYDWNYTFLTVKADAGFTAEGAYGQSNVNFTAVNASADVKLTLTSGGSTVGENAGHEEYGGWYPTTKGISAQATIKSTTTCGLTAKSHADGSSWDTALINASVVSWGKKSSSDDKTATQSACQTDGGGSGGGGSGYVICYYRIYYDEWTGIILGVTPLGCYDI
jgi:hypothetical protein